jgi:hypothetical protein
VRTSEALQPHLQHAHHGQRVVQPTKKKLERRKEKFGPTFVRNNLSVCSQAAVLSSSMKIVFHAEGGCDCLLEERSAGGRGVLMCGTSGGRLVEGTGPANLPSNVNVDGRCQPRRRSFV